MGVTRIGYPLEPDDYAETWITRRDGWKLGTPWYYQEFLAEHRDRMAAALTVLVEALAGGGVVVHCMAGRDRTGLVVAMALDLVGVDHDEIIADHWLSYGPADSAVVDLVDPVDPDSAPITIDRADNAAALHQMLTLHPAWSCFGGQEQAEIIRTELLRQFRSLGPQ
jgi:hypothetical protein